MHSRKSETGKIGDLTNYTRSITFSMKRDLFSHFFGITERSKLELSSHKTITIELDGNTLKKIHFYISIYKMAFCDFNF